MKFYSETLNKLFDSEKELIAEETRVKVEQEKKNAAEKAKKAEKAARAKEVEDAIKIANKANADALAKLKAFTKDYGYFHTTITDEKASNADPISFADMINAFLDF